MELQIGQAIVFVDENRQERDALITFIHGNPDGIVYTLAGEQIERRQWPCINILTLSSNVDCQDQYGRQAERFSSVVHIEQSSAKGMCYRFSQEAL